MTKKCARCGKTLSLGSFTKNRNYKDGLQRECKACHAARYAANRPQILRQRKVIRERMTPEQRADDRAKQNQYNKEYRSRHPERVRELARANARKYYQRHPEKLKAVRAREREKYRARYLLKAHGLTLGAFEMLMRAQDGQCAICGTALESGIGGVMIDHDHVTGEVRGLLCLFCNTALGLFRDRIENLMAAAEYLRERSAPDLVIREV